VSAVAVVAEASVPGARRRFLRHRGVGTLALSTLICALLLAPLVLVILDARGTGWSEVRQVLFRQRSAQLLENTVQLAVLVVFFAVLIGSAAAWATERTALPGRRLWRVLLVLPVAIPDFVVGYAWHSIAPVFTGLWAATLVMTLGTYPLVYLPVMAALRRADPELDDAARGLGAGRLETWWRVSVPLLRPAIVGGAVLVVLTVLAEYGAFEILRYQTFTTEIFTEFKFDQQAAGVLSVPLVLLGLLVLSIDLFLPRRTVTSGTGRRATMPAGRWWARGAALAGVVGLLTLAVGVPLGTLGYWMAQSRYTTLPAAATLGSATAASLGYSAAGAAVAVLAALPVAMLTFRRTTRMRSLLERGTFVTQALPGVVIALSLVFFATTYAYGLYQTSALLVAAYAIMHFPLALVCVKTSVAQAPATLVDTGRSLGVRSVAVFFRVTLPLLAPGLLAGFCLVFLTAITELTATLVLAPIGVSTLATQFWAYQSEVAYGAAAPYALTIVALAAIPGALLALWFDRGTPQGARLAQ
jgi:iron(III) transport system permease protein